MKTSIKSIIVIASLMAASHSIFAMQSGNQNPNEELRKSINKLNSFHAHYWATHGGDVNMIVKDYTVHGFGLKIKGDLKPTLLESICLDIGEPNRFERIKLLLSLGADPNIPDSTGATPLWWMMNYIVNDLESAQGNAGKIIKLLLDNNALSSIKSQGITASGLLLNNPHLERVKRDQILQEFDPKTLDALIKVK